MAASRSARKRRSSRTAPAQPVILTDARLLPGIVGKAVEEGLQPIARRLLVLEGRLDSPSAGESRTGVAIDGETSRAAHRVEHAAVAASATPKSEGAIESAARRVHRVLTVVANIRDQVNGTALRVIGSRGGSAPSAASTEKGEGQKADIADLFAVIDTLDSAVESLEAEAHHLCAQL